MTLFLLEGGASTWEMSRCTLLSSRNAYLRHEDVGWRDCPGVQHLRRITCPPHEPVFPSFILPACRAAGAVTWFPVHCTSMNNTNRLVSGDNKGAASQVRLGSPPFSL